MNKWKSFLTALLASALIIACAFLPQMTASAMDWTKNGKNTSAPIQPVELNFHDGTQPEDMVRKMAVEQRMYTIPIDLSEASMTKDEVYAAAERCMADYVDAGIFEWFSYTNREAESILGIDSTDIDNTAIIWSVTFVNENDPYQYLFLHLDDETGKILYLFYENYEKHIVYPENDPAYAAQMNFSLDRFTQIFFEQLGLSDIRQYNDSNELYTQGVVDGGVYVRNYCIGDKTYGEINIEFYATPAGFYFYYHG